MISALDYLNSACDFCH
uniref:Uncharacterized protein n=1 Tax=Arundo donax TaxID=35708 RepID=A0A0A9BDU9_ARUDO